MKRTRLKRMSSAKRKEKRDTDAERRNLITTLGRCGFCGIGLNLEVHEILCGHAYRHKSVYHRECQLVLCRTCHEQLQGAPLAEQLAVKLVSDPWWFSLDVIREVKDTGGIIVTMDDVRQAARLIGFLPDLND